MSVNVSYQQKPDEADIQNHIQFIDKVIDEAQINLRLEKVRHIKTKRCDKEQLLEINSKQVELRGQIKDLNDDRCWLHNERKAILKKCSESKMTISKEKAKKYLRDVRTKQRELKEFQTSRNKSTSELLHLKLDDKKQKNFFIREASLGIYHAKKQEVIAESRRCKSVTYKRLRKMADEQEYEKQVKQKVFKIKNFPKQISTDKLGELEESTSFLRRSYMRNSYRKKSEEEDSKSTVIDNILKDFKKKREFDSSSGFDKAKSTKMSKVYEAYFGENSTAKNEAYFNKNSSPKNKAQFGKNCAYDKKESFMTKISKSGSEKHRYSNQPNLYVRSAFGKAISQRQNTE